MIISWTYIDLCKIEDVVDVPVRIEIQSLEYMVSG